MNAGDYMKTLLNQTQNVTYKAATQPSSITECNTYKDVLSLDAYRSWTSMQTINAYSSQQVCETIKPVISLKPKYKPYVAFEQSSTASPTQVCQTNTYRDVIKRCNNTMSQRFYLIFFTSVLYRGPSDQNGLW